MHVMEKKDREFTQIIWDYYHANKRSMPWREDVSPYSVFVSEIMLQQTQVRRVLLKYSQFMEAFPTFSSLADSDTKTLLSLWRGMGYNRRALYLKNGAKTIRDTYNGVLPDDPNKLDSLPGIGQATARAMIVFAYNKPYPYIETNIRRIYIHHYFPDKTRISDNDLLPVIERTLDRINPREWHWALMDYGAYLTLHVDNPNTKSSGYKKQSPFKGSIREVRGNVISLLLKRPHTKKELERLYEKDSRLPHALSRLQKEGFIREKRGTYTIA